MRVFRISLILILIGAPLIMDQGTKSHASTLGLRKVFWVQTHDSVDSDHEWASDIAADHVGNVYVTGSSAGAIVTVRYDKYGRKRWVRRFRRRPGGADSAEAVAVDKRGNIYVAGDSDGRRTSTDFVILKYGRSGRLRWKRFFNGRANGIDFVQDLALDNKSNIYITGTSAGVNDPADFVTVKFDLFGKRQWVRRQNGFQSGYDMVGALALDQKGNIFVTGSSHGGSDDGHITTVKYSSSGRILWVRRYGSATSKIDIPTDITTHGSNVFVAGMSYDPNTGFDYLTIKYDSEGRERWAARYNGPGNDVDYINKVIVDRHGNVHVTGASTGYRTDLDYATIKYSPGGRVLWRRRYNSSVGGNDRSIALGLDAKGNVFVTGASQARNVHFDVVTIRYSATGRRQWVNRYNGTGNKEDTPMAMAMGGAGKVLVAGYTFGADTGYDFLAMKFKP